MARRRRKTKVVRRRKPRKGVTLTDDQKLQLLAQSGLDDELKRKILKA